MNNKNNNISPDYIFETSWEVCNKVGGIYTVISTKAISLVETFGDNYILIGPDVWKETHENPEFIEDHQLFRPWREKAADDGLKFRIGRWNIAGEPIVILIDFTPYFSQKNEIFSHFWETYQLDSLSGHWDYIEPALFGYAAAKVIHSFYDCFVSSSHKLVAHFHEWMTGTGVLYLKDQVPQASTVFTTHATAVGRSIAGNGLPLYKDLKAFDANILANNFGIRSKYSLEKISAMEADAFTTVSDITAKECHYLLNKDVDVVTPNGFEDSFVPSSEKFDEKRSFARSKIIAVVEAILNQKISPESTLIINSGRYEFRNKGIDLFIKALGDLNKQSIDHELVAVIAVPAHHTGPRGELIQRIGNPDYDHPARNEFLTHNLHDKQHDPVLEAIAANGLNNNPEDKVKIIFVPSYLNGQDGIFNMDYYDFLIGFDISVFPSYYEPWGYTPLESIAFHIPTITTTLAGFGQWVNSKYGKKNSGVIVVERNDEFEDVTTEAIKKALFDFSNQSKSDRKNARAQAYEVSRIALWENLIAHYFEAYTVALQKSGARAVLYKSKIQTEQLYAFRETKPEKPTWRKILVTPQVNGSFNKLYELSRNLWWSWNYEAMDLFKMIDPGLWESYRNNPIALLEALSIDKIEAMKRDGQFMEKLHEVYSTFRNYMDQKKSRLSKSVAYFSMEYGLHDTLKIFSGGLGILAGDFLKEASDSNLHLVGVGLLYRYGYFNQTISLFGDQISSYTPQKFTHLPVIPVRDEKGDWIKVKLALPGRVVYAKIWLVEVGRISLYLLDTDITENSDSDRAITHQLYGGDNENRLKQELVLGVGGIRLMEALGFKPDIFHCNEGHAAFIGFERLRKYVQEEHLTFMEAKEVVRSSTLFTTHTPVPAGHDLFDEDLLRTYLPHYADRLNLTWADFMNLGRFHKNDPEEKFSMSVLAANLSQEMNGVSKIHGRESRKMFNVLYDGYYPGELHIGYVTNGVHYFTWTSEQWQKLFLQYFGQDFLGDLSNPDHWRKILQVPDEIIWDTKQEHRRKLVSFIKARVKNEMTLRQENPKLILKTLEKLDDKTLTVAFARRFATYKRAHLLFSNLERLSSILNNEERPVQFIFAGKAHPNDKAGQDLIRRIIEISKIPEFVGKIIFIENYNIALAKELVSSVDVWLNTPTRPLEASGTSGEKATMNGVINCSVLDGWWAEGYLQGAGFAIQENRTYTNQPFQDELDAETIYGVFEDEIIPLFYDRNDQDIPVKWVAYIKNAIAQIAPHYTMKRMLDDYSNNYYQQLIKRSEAINKDNYKLAGEMASWKKMLMDEWDNIKIISVKVPDSTVSPLKLGQNFIAEIEADVKGISPGDLGVEVIFGNKENNEIKKVLFKKELKLREVVNGHAIFVCEFLIEKAGVYDYIFRMYPVNPNLPHRQDFDLIKLI